MLLHADAHAPTPAPPDALRGAFLPGRPVAGVDGAEAVGVARVVAASVLLSGAAWMDLRTRRVPNRYWTPWLAAAALFALADVALRPLDDAFAVTWLVAFASVVVFYGLWWMRLLFGGADAKAFMVLALVAPWPVTDAWALRPAVDTLVNATVVSLAVPVVLLVANVARGRFAGVATFVAVPMAIERARGRYVWPLERVADGTLARRLWQRRDEDLDAVYDALGAAGVATVWATPKVPFLAFAVAGWLLAVFAGNLMLAAVARLIA